MFNLLPDLLKEAIHREFKMRLAVFIVAGILSTLCVGIILLIPSYLLSRTIENEVTVTKGLIDKSLSSKENATLKITLAETREVLDLLSSKEESSTISTLLKQVIALKSDSISITRLSYTALSDKERQLTVAGIAENRDTLLAFKKKIGESKLFFRIDLPISNFTDETNILFTMTLTGNF